MDKNITVGISILVGIFIFGIFYNLRKKSKLEIKAKIPPERMAINLIAVLAFLIAILIIKKFSAVFIDVTVVFVFGFIYYITALLSEGMTKKGIRTFNSFNMLSKFVYWKSIHKINVNVEERYVKLDIMSTKTAGFQYYLIDDIDNILALFKENKISYTVYR